MRYNDQTVDISGHPMEDTPSAPYTLPPYAISTKKGSPDFDEIKNRIEPFRKILFEMGKNESCLKCEAYFKESLFLKKPAKYDIAKLKALAGSKQDATGSGRAVK